MNDCEKPNGWKQGMLDAALILAICPDGAGYRERRILDLKRTEILRIASADDPKPSSRQRLGDGVTAQMAFQDVQLSVRNGDGTEATILMSKETCEALMRYIRQNVFCREEG